MAKFSYNEFWADLSLGGDWAIVKGRDMIHLIYEF